MVKASAFGLLRCLRALAQEATDLRMFRTLSAIEDALEAAARESGVDIFEDGDLAGAGAGLMH